MAEKNKVQNFTFEDQNCKRQSVNTVKYSFNEARDSTVTKVSKRDISNMIQRIVITSSAPEYNFLSKSFDNSV